MAYRFAADETMREAFARTAHEQLLAAETALTHDLDADPVDAIHSARKAIKKERTLLRLMRGSLARGDRRHENAALRQAARRLSGARDAEVMVQTLDGLADRYVGQVPHHEFAALRERLQDGASGGADAAAAAQAATELRASRERIAAWKLDRGGWAAVEPGLRHSYERGITAFALARADASDERLHDWRKRVKDLWYDLRLLEEVCGPSVRGQAKDAHALADLLGDDHDLAVLRDRVVGIAGGVAADVDAVLALLDHRRSQLQAQATALGERVYAERPKAFARRLRACWRAGRRQHREARRDPAQLADLTRAPVAH